ncbi:hypothetical protein PVAP13_4KG339988 [Panicum virgatum]|uniref:Uncharacterized protein n=1 Tax=Panicum virgatum TaxID=38727 RepID=A0A8T0TX83_PANVG|nr:hypothetical protein PVAP13_4KG339988 [Panicum virgatum]
MEIFWIFPQFQHGIRAGWLLPTVADARPALALPSRPYWPPSRPCLPPVAAPVPAGSSHRPSRRLSPPARPRAGPSSPAVRSSSSGRPHLLHLLAAIAAASAPPVAEPSSCRRPAAIAACRRCHPAGAAFLVLVCASCLSDCSHGWSSSAAPIYCYLPILLLSGFSVKCGVSSKRDINRKGLNVITVVAEITLPSVVLRNIPIF